MKNTLQWILAIIMAVAACNTLAGESDIRINANPQPSNPGWTPPQTSTPAQLRPVNESTLRGMDNFELAQGNNCVRVLVNARLRMQPCNSGTAVDRVYWVARKDGTIGRSNWAKSCLWAPPVFTGNPKDKTARVATCTDGLKATVFGSNRTVVLDVWTILQDGRIVLWGGLKTDRGQLKYVGLPYAPQCLEYSPSANRVIVAPCEKNKPTQNWTPHFKVVKHRKPKVVTRYTTAPSTKTDENAPLVVKSGYTYVPPSGKQIPATYKGEFNKSCPKGSFRDLLNGSNKYVKQRIESQYQKAGNGKKGTCWQCPDGYKRSVKPIWSESACIRK